MTFQTFVNNDNNRQNNSPEGLESRLRSLWLGRRDDYRTFAGLTEAENEEAIGND